MKKKVKLIYFIVLALFGLSIFNSENVKANSGAIFPEEILEDEAYRDLPEDAKKLVKENYEKTESLILTEKNKKAGKPYLNPKYAEYLGMSDEEKEDVSVIPETYVVDYQLSGTFGNTSGLPSSFDLRNVNGKKYITDLKNQNELSICWAFGSIEQVESYLMLHDDDFYANPTKFSTRQMDYSVASNSLTDLTENPEILLLHDQSGNIKKRKLGDSANYLYSSSIMTRGLSLVNELNEPWKNLFWTKNDLTQTPTLEKSQVLNYGNSLYEVNSTIDNQILTRPFGMDDISWGYYKASFIDGIKERIMEYGGAHVGTQSPSSSCSASNLKDGQYNGTRIINTDGHCVEDSGHSMQLIGWDDDYEYEYSYCDGSGKYSGEEVHNYKDGECSSGAQTVTGKGAWLLRNSWGNKIGYDYVWLAYDSTTSTINYATNVTKMSERNWDKVYSKNMTDSIASDVETDLISIKDKEKIQKIKFQTTGIGITYNVLIWEDGAIGEPITVTVVSEEPGYYTADFSDKNVILENKNIKIEVADSYCELNTSAYCDPTVFVDSIQVFTKSQTIEPKIETEKDEIIFTESELVASTDFYKIRPYSTTKNIQSNAEISYKLFNLNNEDVTLDYIESIEYNIVATNDVFPKIMIRGSIPEGVYKLKATYGSAESVITIAIGYARLPGGLELDFTHGVYDEQNNTVDEVEPGMSMDDFLSTILTSQDYYVSNIEDQKVHTGAKIGVYDFENHLIKEVKIIVRGDVDGDGVIDPLDYAKIRKHIMNAFLEGIYLKAADYNKDNMVDIIDYIKMRNFVSPSQPGQDANISTPIGYLTINIDENKEVSITGNNCAGKLKIESLDSSIASVLQSEIFADHGITEKITIRGNKAGVTKIKISSETVASYSSESFMNKIEIYIDIVVLEEPGKGGNDEKNNNNVMKPQFVSQNQQFSTPENKLAINNGVDAKLISKQEQKTEGEKGLTVSEMFNIILLIIIIVETITIIILLFKLRKKSK